MGLDVTLAVIVLIAGIRGWLKGFIRQAIGIGALVGCVYLADPVRDQIRPYALSYFPSIPAELFEKVLWWTCVLACYVVTAGTALLIVKAYRRKSYGDTEPNRGDQGGGFALGTLKGLIVACFLTAGITRWESNLTRFTGGTWFDEQIKTSQALNWSTQYRPAERMWNAPPVQAFVRRVIKRGSWVDMKKAAEPETPELQAAAPRPRTLNVPPPSTSQRLDPSSPEFLREVDDLMRREGIRNSR